MPNFAVTVFGIALHLAFHQIVSAGIDFKNLPSPSIRPDGVIQDFSLQTWNIATLKKECTKGVKFIETLGEDIGSAETLDDTLFKRILECDRLYSCYGSTIGGQFSFGAIASNSQKMRKVCEELMQKLSKAFLEFDMRKDVYHKLVAFKSSKGDNSLGDAELDKCLDKLIVDRKQNGLHIPDIKVEEIEKVKKEISKLETQYVANLTNETLELYFTEKELEGLDLDLENLRKNEVKGGEHAGKIRVTPNRQLLIKCVNPDTRRVVEKTLNSRCVTTNAGIVKKLFSLRAQLANLIEGDATYAEYILKPLMGESPDKVLKFLRELIPNAKNRWQEEKDVMLRLKAAECDKYKWNCDKTKLEMSDYTHFYEKMSAEKYKLDDKELRNYFPLETVLKGIFKIFETVLGLKISRVENLQRWHESVSVYQVQDNQDGRTGEILGYAYLDLYKRDGKISYIPMFDMQQGGNDGKGEKLKYVGAVIFNFTNETKENPTLLYHYEVQALLGSLGNLVGRICSKAKTSLFNGWIGSQTDFHLAPVEMLRNWCYEEKSLRLMSRHFKKRTPLPTDLIEKLVASRTKNGGVDLLFKLAYAITDQELHNLKRGDIDDANFDPLKIYTDIVLDLTGLEVTKGTDTLASWIHLGGGFGAQYYIYLWSEAYGADMFDSTFKQEGDMLSPAVGKRLREKLYAPGGILTGSELFKNFLNRTDNSMNMKPFLERFGLKKSN